MGNCSEEEYVSAELAIEAKTAVTVVLLPASAGIQHNTAGSGSKNTYTCLCSQVGGRPKRVKSAWKLGAGESQRGFKIHLRN